MILILACLKISSKPSYSLHESPIFLSILKSRDSFRKKYSIIYSSLFRSQRFLRFGIGIQIRPPSHETHVNSRTIIPFLFRKSFWLELFSLSGKILVHSSLKWLTTIPHITSWYSSVSLQIHVSWESKVFFSQVPWFIKNSNSSVVLIQNLYHKNPIIHMTVPIIHHQMDNDSSFPVMRLIPKPENAPKRNAIRSWDLKSHFFIFLFFSW